MILSVPLENEYRMTRFYTIGILMGTFYLSAAIKAFDEATQAFVLSRDMNTPGLCLCSSSSVF